MRTFIAVLMLLALLVSVACGEVPGNRLGLELLSVMADGTENEFVSPVSLAYALSMAAEGASGETRTGILLALDADDPADIAGINQSLSEAGLKWSNAAFAQAELKVYEDYRLALSETFESEWFEMDEHIVEDVNKWVKSKTDGLIEGILDEPLDPEIMMILLNAIAMDAQWKYDFDPMNTREDIFHSPDGDIPAEFMYRQLHADYNEIEGTQIIRLEYKDSSLAMYLALPPEGKADAALEILADQGLGYFRFGDKEKKVRLRLPKMDILVNNGLKAPLMEMGLEIVFTEEADFSGVSEMPLFISDLLQKVRVQVDEEGTKAAAVTAVMLAPGAAPMQEEIYEMAMDRPFLMVIAEEETGAVCFAGLVADPTK